jgi:hypothetical protein
MKTHEVAKALVALANFLRSAPNVELNSLQIDARARSRQDTSDIPIALGALVALSSFDKAQWRAVISEYNLPVEVKATESTRDIVGKILRQLHRDPESRRKLKVAAQQRPGVSPELIKALDFLLK